MSAGASSLGPIDLVFLWIVASACVARVFRAATERALSIVASTPSALVRSIREYLEPVRALAMGELTAANALRFIGKEFAVGGLNGLIFAALMGAGVVLWYGDWRLGAVIAAAMVCNLVAAALAGTLIPLTLQKIGVDPAVSSTVFLTTVTDVVGFLAFLGLATLFLL